jgi:hypothetical protein
MEKLDDTLREVVTEFQDKYADRSAVGTPTFLLKKYLDSTI